MGNEKHSSISSAVSEAVTEFNAQEQKEQQPGAEPEQNTDNQPQGDTGQDKEQSQNREDSFTGDFEKDVPKEFHKNARWQEIYGKAKKAKELEQKLIEIEEKQFDPNSLSDDQIEAVLKAKGIIPSESENESGEPDHEFENTEKEKEAYDLNNLTEQDQKAIKFLDWYISKKLNPVQSELKQHSQFLTQAQLKEYEKTLSADEEKTKKWVTDDLKMDWEKDVVPGVSKMLQEKWKTDPNWGTKLTPSEITKFWLSDKLLEQGKKLGLAEAQKLNEQKKEKQFDTTNIQTGGKETDYSQERNLSTFVNKALQEARQKFSP